jgi:hypothetical protein
VILRGDEMAELPTDAVNSRYRPKADCYERPLLGETSSHLWPNQNFVKCGFIAAFFLQGI